MADIHCMSLENAVVLCYKAHFKWLFALLRNQSIRNSNRKVIGSTPVGRTRNFFPSMPVSLIEKIHQSHSNIPCRYLHNVLSLRI